MAGALTISTLNNDTGVLATQNGMTGIAKAWARFNGVSGVSVASSFNVSSISRNAAGDYTVNFTTAMVDANYSVFVQSGEASYATNWSTVAPIFGTLTTSAVRIGTTNGLTQADSAFVSVSILSS